jgi:hypothetical protein
MNELISDLKMVSARLASNPSDQTITLRLIDEAIVHLTAGSDGSATGIELDLIAMTLRAQNLLPEAELLEQVAQLLVQSGNRSRAAMAREAMQANRPSNVVPIAQRRDTRRRR